MPGIFVLTARQNGKMSSVKMVNKGNGTRNGIEYVGTVETLRATSLQIKSETRGDINRPFDIGDQMSYTGYTYVNGAEIRSTRRIEQQQFNSEEIVFDFIVPVTNPNDGQPCENTPTLTDVDGHTYNTIQLGSQCWMKENLRTTKYADNTAIALGSDTSTTIPYRYYPNNSLSNVSTYGYLYNWKAAMGNASSSNSNPSGVQGICPNGWHVPSEAEWRQLTDYIEAQPAYVCSECPASEWLGSIQPNCIAKSLASKTGWNSYNPYVDASCSINYDPSSNNATGFGARPAGTYGFNDEFGDCAVFCSSTLVNNYYADGLELRNTSYRAGRLAYHRYQGVSVRCLRD